MILQRARHYGGITPSPVMAYMISQVDDGKPYTYKLRSSVRRAAGRLCEEGLVSLYDVSCAAGMNMKGKFTVRDTLCIGPAGYGDLTDEDVEQAEEDAKQLVGRLLADLGIGMLQRLRRITCTRNQQLAVA